MKTQEVITEAMLDPKLRGVYEKKGYKFVGKGQDADVFLSPDGTVTKIFGTNRDSTKGIFTRAQLSFIDFAEYCKAHPENPYLPNILGWKRFEYPSGSDFWYLEINVERLFDFNNAIGANGKTFKYGYLARELETLGNFIDDYGRIGPQKYLSALDKQRNYGKFTADADELLLNLGEDGFKQLSQAMVDLLAIANKNNYGYDLHEGNFMLSSEGHMVINDPFFTGTWRAKPSRK